MAKKRVDQDNPMDVYAVRMPSAMARHIRKIGGGVLSEGVRALGDKSMRGFVERRRGPLDRRKK